MGAVPWPPYCEVDERLHPTLIERFLQRIRVTDEGCWEWTRSTSSNGYSQIQFGGRKGKRWTGHRLAFLLWNGYEPPEDIDHLCRNKTCVNPAHLEAVTRRENARRGLKGILKTHCVHGHPFDEVNTAYTKTGWRRCRECGRISDRRRRRAS